MVARKSTNARAQDRRFAPSPTLTSLAAALLAASVLLPASAGAVGSLANVELVPRGDDRALPTAWGQGRHWVVGTPGQAYAIRVCNTTPGRVLAVTSVDGINVISGDTASPDQSGYVLDAHACMDIAGWRKNMARIAAFYFTELPDSYAARTGRPDNLGVIGVALFREKAPPPVAWRAPAKMAADAQRETSAANAPEATGAALPAEAKRLAGATAAAPMPRAQLGTGHGRSEASRAHQVRFERESNIPAETIALHYDRRDNLVAMGILPPPVIARSQPANPFPGQSHFVPDPPRR